MFRFIAFITIATTSSRRVLHSEILREEIQSWEYDIDSSLKHTTLTSVSEEMCASYMKHVKSTRGHPGIVLRLFPDQCINMMVEYTNYTNFCENHRKVCIHMRNNLINGKHNLHKHVERRILFGYMPDGRNLPDPIRTPSPTLGKQMLSSIYYEYPDGITIDLDDDTKFEGSYTILHGKALVDTLEHIDIPAQVLTQSRDREEFAGFIFHNNILEHILVHRPMSEKNYVLPSLKKATGYKIIEKRFSRRAPNVYIEEHFGFVNRTRGGYHREGILDYILWPISQMTPSEIERIESLCDEIPRCLGYIPSRGLVSTTPLRKGLELIDGQNPLHDGEWYMEKELRHDIITWVQNHIVPTILVLSALQVVFFAVIFM